MPLGTTAGTYDDFFEELGDHESGGFANQYIAENALHYIGKYQMSENALIDTGYYRKRVGVPVPNTDQDAANDWDGQWENKSGVNSKQDYFDNHAAQEASVREYAQVNWGYAKANNYGEQNYSLQESLRIYDSQTLDGKKITISGMLAGMHLLGHGGLQDFIQNGGITDLGDANGTKFQTYLGDMADYDTPFTVNHAGNDTLKGGDGDDKLAGGAGLDSIVGGAGNDLLYGYWNNEHFDETADSENLAQGDTIKGGTGNDTIVGSKGADSLLGEAGNDTIVSAETDKVNTIDGGADHDVIWGSGLDVIKDSAGNDTVWGNGIGEYTDTVSGDQDVFIAHKGENKVYGTDENLKLVFDPANANTALDFHGTLTASQKLYIGSTLIQGSFNRDYINTDTASTSLGNGWYMMFVGETPGVDYGGNRLLFYTEDRIVPVPGYPDSYYVPDAQVVIWGFVNGMLGITVAGYQSGGAAYTINPGGPISQTPPDVADFTAPVKVTKTGSESADSLTGAAQGADLRGLAGNDTLTGSANADALDGGAGIDSLTGGNGNDVLDGGADADLLRGGVGADTFKFSNAGHSVEATALDRIFDFETASDKIDLTGLGFTALTANATTTAGQLRLAYESGTNRTYARSDQSTFEFYMDGNKTGLTSANFIFGASTSTVPSAGNDSLTGTASADNLDALAGNDTVDGLGGNDTLQGNAGADLIAGSDGNDSMLGDLSTDTLGGGDTLNGGNGNDTLVGYAGNDLLDGGAGDDMLAGGAGADTLNGGLNADFINYSSSTAAVNVSLVTGTGTGGHAQGDVISNVERIIGSGYGDTLAGDGGNNTLDGGNGADSLVGGGGLDSLIGGASNDTLAGDAGGDTLSGGAGDNRFTGGADLDRFVLSADAGTETITDFAVAASGGLYEKIDLSAIGSGLSLTLTQVGADTQFTAGSRTVVLQGVTASALVLDHFIGVASISVSGGSGSTSPSTGNDSITGTSGADTVDALAGNDTVDGLGGNDSLQGNAGADLLYGGDGNDTLTGDLSTDTLGGGDTLSGGIGNDMLVGYAGNDSLDGGANDDVLSGGAGADTMDGGSGALDLINYSSSTAAVNVSLVSGTGTGGHAQGDVFLNVERIIGSGNADTLTGDGNANTLSGGNGADSLVGGGGNDSLSGAELADALIGGVGSDTLNGGLGADIFVFVAGDSTTTARDLVADFEQGSDVIDVSAIAGINGLGDLTVSQVGATTQVDFGTGTGFSLLLTGNLTLTASDFAF